ncbi:MFS transporter [Alicyclobacillus sp.]|uniref:MFS transporter n=1 Tax=Alicyclobacillus sp. TaxID=61169 RepID=UPI0025C39662|nr:MFS transporter [Alicyclobacillus sp.]MCL6516303.1 MFS transporter [Alicyclobacillus sp.]
MEAVFARGGGWIRGIPPVVWLLMTASFLNITGLSFLWPVNAIYIHEILGQPMTIAGTVLLVYSGAGLVGSFLAGAGYDRIGALPVLTAAFALCAISILVPLWIGGWVAYMAVMAVFGLACAMPFPVFNALVGHAWPEGGRRAYNLMYVANNIGVAVGTALGGILAQHSFVWVFGGISLANALLLGFTWMGLGGPLRRIGRGKASSLRPADETAAPADGPGAGGAAARVPWQPIGFVLAGFTVGWCIYVQWQSAISVYMQQLGYPLSAYSVLWTLNGLLIFGLQPAVSVIVRRLPRLEGLMALGVALYAVAFVAIAVRPVYPVFVAAMAVMTFGEVLAWPSVPAAIGQLAPPERLGFLQGLVGSTATLGRMIGPIAGGWLFDHAGAPPLLWAAAALCAVPVALFLASRASIGDLPTVTDCQSAKSFIE